MDKCVHLVEEQAISSCLQISGNSRQDCIEACPGPAPDITNWLHPHPLIKFAATLTVQGLIHISELSWSRISTPEMVVQPGSLVRCKVISVDRAENRIGLSLKQMEADPLMETLESVLPAGEQPEFSEVPCDIPPTIEDICGILKTTGGIEAVNLGRCAREKRAVSQVHLAHALNHRLCIMSSASHHNPAAGPCIS